MLRKNWKFRAATLTLVVLTNVKILAQIPSVLAKPGSPATEIKKATSDYLETKPPVVCRIPARMAVLRWKCPVRVRVAVPAKVPPKPPR